MLALILIILGLTIVYYFLNLNYQYWNKRGVPGPKPILLLGNFGKCFMLRDSPGTLYSTVYNKYQHDDMVGMYRGVTPVLLVRDPNLVNEVTVKSFSSFHDNDVEMDPNTDLIFGKNPFVLKGDEWKMVRGQLTPGFTSGKMKWLYPLLEETCINLVKFIDSKPEMTNGDGYEAKELCTRFTLNNVASCAFGLEGRCFEEENSKFRQLAREFFSHDSWSVINFFVLMIFPSLSKLLRVRFIPAKVEKKLIDMVTQTLKYRQENNVVRNDFLHIMTQLKHTCKAYEFTDLDVTAHAAGFFGDGYETSSIVMSFTLFELSANPKAQSKLREELNTAFEENNQKLPYDILQTLRYLDAVINEALRIHPPMFWLQKMCTKSFTYVSKSLSKSVTIEKGTPVILSVYGLHHDPKYYENPESYEPERFVGSNVENLTKYTFLPMGEGPRACLGQRFGILQVKSAIAYIILNYELSVNKKTKLPIKYDPTNVMTSPIGGLWMNFKKVRI